MDGDLIQARIYGGLKKAALRLGRSHDHYRPSGANTPLHIDNKLGTILAAFSTKGSWYGFHMSSPPGNRQFHVLVDGAEVNVGDYLVHSEGTFFIAQKQHIAPLLAMKCNATFDLRRTAQPTSVGLNDYGGMIEATETVYASGWPGALTMGGGSRGAAMVLPSDPGALGFHIMLPAIPGVVIQIADILRDQLNTRYHVKGAVLSDTGWNIVASPAVT